MALGNSATRHLTSTLGTRQLASHSAHGNSALGIRQLATRQLGTGLGLGWFSNFSFISWTEESRKSGPFCFLKSGERTLFFCFESYKLNPLLDPPSVTLTPTCFHQQTGFLHDVFDFAGTLKKCDAHAAHRQCIARRGWGALPR